MGTKRLPSCVLAFGLASASLAVAGCADTATRAELADVKQRLDAEQRRAAAAERKIDELENRVFLLTDQVESQKVAAVHRAPKALPVVTLKPDAAVDAEPTDDVTFEGDARSADPEHTRPLLRIDGTRPTAAARRTSLDAERRGDGENLGVGPVPPIHAAAPSERSAPAVEPLALYRTAYDDLRAGRHGVAEREFRDFVRRFPHHDYADNAQYWLGECFYDQKRFDKAAPEFRAVVQRWPTGNKAPDAMLKLGFSLIALGDVDKARATLRELPAAYPRTEAARLASERLLQLQSTEGPK
jgi:tol-pal system protein YbgF